MNPWCKNINQILFSNFRFNRFSKRWKKEFPQTKERRKKSKQITYLQNFQQLNKRIRKKKQDMSISTFDALKSQSFQGNDLGKTKLKYFQQDFINLLCFLKVQKLYQKKESVSELLFDLASRFYLQEQIFQNLLASKNVRERCEFEVHSRPFCIEKFIVFVQNKWFQNIFSSVLLFSLSSKINEFEKKMINNVFKYMNNNDKLLADVLIIFIEMERVKTPRPQVRTATLKSSSGCRRRKTLSSHIGGAPFLEKGEQMKYSILAEQSINKDYKLSNLQPFSTHQKISQIESEISDLGASRGKTRRMFKSSGSVFDKLQTICNEASPKKKKRRKFQRGSFIKSLIENEEQALMDEYTEEIETDQKNKQQTIESINRKIIQEFPSNVCFESSEGKMIKNKILGFKQEKRVASAYIIEQPNLANFKPPKVKMSSYLKLSKDDFGAYSRSARRPILSNSSTQKHNQKIDAPKSGKFSKIIYKSYMKNYRERKQIIHSIIS